MLIGFFVNNNTKMTEKEYLKYNNPSVFDKLGKPIRPGDTVVINNHYGTSPCIGVVDHFTQNGRLAILYDWQAWKGTVVKLWAYRVPRTVIKLKSGRRKK